MAMFFSGPKSGHYLQVRLYWQKLSKLKLVQSESSMLREKKALQHTLRNKEKEIGEPKN